MPTDQFKCANCPYAIDASGLNKIQLKALRMWARTCPKCGQMTKWIEQASLLENENNISNGGSQNANTNQSVSKTQSQKRRASRHDGSH